jgi:hypothetical protein
LAAIAQALGESSTSIAEKIEKEGKIRPTARDTG